MKHLASLKSLHHLDISGCSNVTTQGIVNLDLSKLTQLNYLDISKLSFRTQTIDFSSEDGLNVLRGLPATLKHLDLGFGKLNDESCKQIFCTKAQLEFLGLAGYESNVTEDGLLGLPWSLKSLDLTLTPINDDGISGLVVQRNLESLNLWGCKNLSICHVFEQLCQPEKLRRLPISEDEAFSWTEKLVNVHWESPDGRYWT